VYWIDLAQDVERKVSMVNMVMIPRVPPNVEQFLRSCQLCSYHYHLAGASTVRNVTKLLLYLSLLASGGREEWDSSGTRS
jgi:hypothetical protein